MGQVESTARDYLRYGISFLNQDKYQEAITYFDKVINKQPIGEAYLYKALALKALGRENEATNYFISASKYEYKNIDCHKFIVLYLFQVNRPAELLRSLELNEKLINKEPKNADHYHFKLVILEALGAHGCLDQQKKIDSIEILRKLLELEPDNLKNYLSLGMTLLHAKKFEDSLHYFNVLTQLDRYNTDAHFFKAFLAQGLGRSKEALPSLKILTQQQPNDPEVQFWRGETLYDLGKKEKAIKYFNNAIELAPGNPLYYCHKGRALKELGKEFEALECFNKVYEISEEGNIYFDDKKTLEFINQTITTYRVDLLKKVAELQQAMNDAKDSFTKLEQVINNSKSCKEDLDNLLKENKEIVDLAMFNLSTRSNFMSSDIDNRHLLTKLTDILAKSKTFTVSINNEVNTVKQQQNIHTEEIASYGKNIKTVIERQDKTDERLEKLELFHKTTEDIIQKLSGGIKASPRDKERICDLIKDIEEKVQSLASKDDVSAITEQMIKLSTQGEVTKKRLVTLEEDIDALIAKQECGNKAEIYAVTDIVYDNPLLNHPTLLKEASSYLRSMSKAIDLSNLLSSSIINEAIETQDSELILAGMMSLQSNCNH